MNGTVDEVEVGWVSLGDAFSHALAVAEAELGVKRPRGCCLEAEAGGVQWRPSANQIKLLLKENVDVEVDDPDGERKKKILSLSELAATRAHIALMRSLREKRISARAEWTGNWIKRLDQPASSREILPVPPGFWGAGWTRSGRPSSPIPDYASGAAMTAAVDTNVGFWGSVERVEVRRQDVLAAFGPPPRPEDLPLVEGGTFCLNGTDWLVTCGGETATIPSCNGMGYLAVLLARPNEALTWDAVVETGSLVMEGEDPERVLRDGPAYLPEDDSVDLYEDDLTAGWSIDANRNAVDQQDAQSEAESLSNQLRDLRERAGQAPPETRARLEVEIEATKAFLSKAKNKTRRTFTTSDRYRHLFTHALDDAFRYLAVFCPPFVRHMGTYRKEGRRALVARDGRIAYCPVPGPSGVPRWNTAPLAQPPRDATI